MRELQRADPRSANALSVRLELQADCYAGVWGHEAAQPGRAASGAVELDPGDLEEALRAASAIGDDRLQKLGTGRVMPEKFTHGTSEQRVTWFKRGFDSGDPRQCDTFGKRPPGKVSILRHSAASKTHASIARLLRGLSRAPSGAWRGPPLSRT